MIRSWECKVWEVGGLDLHNHCVLNVISRCKFCKNGVFNTFFPLSHTFYFETRPSPLSKIKENAFGAHFLQLYRKSEYGDPHFFIS